MCGCVCLVSTKWYALQFVTREQLMQIQFRDDDDDDVDDDGVVDVDVDGVVDGEARVRCR